MNSLIGRNGSFHNNHGLFSEIPYEITPELIERKSGSFHNNHGLFSEIPYEITPELIESRWDTADLRPGMDGFDGPPTLEPIPNYNPDNDPGFTRMANATDKEWLNIIKTLTGKLG